MNYFDIALLIPLAYGLIRGFIKGLIKEVLALVAIVAGVVIAYFYSPKLALYFSESFDSSGYGINLLSYIILFVLTVITINLIAKYLTSLSKLMALSMLNRFFGGLFGFTKILLIMMLLVFLFDPMLETMKENNKSWKNSKVYPMIQEYSIIPGTLFNEAKDELLDGNELDFPTLETP